MTVQATPSRPLTGQGTVSSILRYLDTFRNSIERLLDERVRVLDRSGATVTVTNSVAITNLYTFSVLGGTLETTKRLRLTLIGDYLNNDGAARDLTLRVLLGGTVVLTTGAVSVTNDAARRIVRVQCEIAANDATNAQAAAGTVSLGAVDTVGGNAPTYTDRLGGHTALTKDTQTDLTLAVDVLHGTASANIVFRKFAAVVELL